MKQEDVLVWDFLLEGIVGVESCVLVCSSGLRSTFGRPKKALKALGKAERR